MIDALLQFQQGPETTTPRTEEKHQCQYETDEERVRRKLDLIRHQVLVLSGKGGVGKSTVAANPAISLALAQKRVGLLDINVLRISLYYQFSSSKTRNTKVRSQRRYEEDHRCSFGVSCLNPRAMRLKNTEPHFVMTRFSGVSLLNRNTS